MTNHRVRAIRIIALCAIAAPFFANIGGASAASRAEARPSAPRSVHASARVDATVAKWIKPASDGGGAVTYTAVARPSGKTCLTALTQCVITGLKPDTAYTVTVRAANRVGRSAPSAPSQPVKPLTPGSTLPPMTTTTILVPMSTTTTTTTVPSSGGPPLTTTTTTTVPPTTTTTTTTSDAQYDNGDVYWGFNHDAAPTSMRQTLSVLRLAPSTFWALNFYSPDAYMGFQTDNSGNPDDAIFSIWGGTNASPGPGSTCQVFGGEGIGENCLLPLDFSTATSYTYSLTNVGGTTWSASITDVATGVTYLIGTITAPTGESTVSGVSNFSEYFGNNFVCNMSSMSTVQWSPPVASASTPTPYTDTATYAGNGRNGENDCSSWSVVETMVNNEPVVDASLGDVAS